MKDSSKNKIAAHYLDNRLVLDQKYSILDYKVVIEHLKNQGKLSIKQISKVIEDCYKYLIYTPNVVKISRPAYVVGSINGNYLSLLSVFEKLDFFFDSKKQESSNFYR